MHLADPWLAVSADGLELEELGTPLASGLDALAGRLGGIRRPLGNDQANIRSDQFLAVVARDLTVAFVDVEDLTGFRLVDDEPVRDALEEVPGGAFEFSALGDVLDEADEAICAPVVDRRRAAGPGQSARDDLGSSRQSERGR